MKKAANRKFKYFSLLLCLLLLMACKKESKEYTTVNFHLYNPVTLEAYSGVHVYIVRSKEPKSIILFNNKSKKEVIWEGITDVNGKASHSFKAFNNLDYTYYETVDENVFNNKYVYSRPFFGDLVKNTVNDGTYKIVNYTNYSFWIKNINCLNSGDKFRWRDKNLLLLSDSWGPWSPWTPDNYHYGCYEFLYTGLINTPQEIKLIEMEVTRNGVVSIIRDTVYLTGQNGIDTLKLFY